MQLDIHEIVLIDKDEFEVLGRLELDRLEYGKCQEYLVRNIKNKKTRWLEHDEGRWRLWWKAENPTYLSKIIYSENVPGVIVKEKGKAIIIKTQGETENTETGEEYTYFDGEIHGKPFSLEIWDDGEIEYSEGLQVTVKKVK